MNILGIHGGVTIGQHEPGAALIVDGKISAVCEEERFLRIKSSYGYLPFYSIKACLDYANLSANDIDLVVTPGVTYDDFEERMRLYLFHSFGYTGRIVRVHHQEAHLATAFYGSGLNKALCVSLDATGDGSCGYVAVGEQGKEFNVLETFETKHSLGYYYSLITSFLGFNDGDEYKVMGLAPYGKANIDLSKVISPQGSSWNFDWNLNRTNPPCRSPFEPKYSEKLGELIGAKPRLPSEPLTPFHENLAASCQAQFELCLNNLLEHYKKAYPELTSLCYAGGVAMNCAANGKVFDSKLFEQIFIPPNSSDRGLALGCAYLGSVQMGDKPQAIDSAALGKSYSSDSIESELSANGISFKKVDDSIQETAKLLADGKIIGWFSGRSESGARALGNRSIIADPRIAEMRDKVNARIKYREKFRPFAPSILREHAGSYFESSDARSPYMCFTFNCKPDTKSKLPSVVHVNNTARIQTVEETQNNRYHALISEFYKQSGSPVILNTSFNLKGQPIVETPRDAIMTFFGCGLDALVFENFIVEKPSS